MFVSQFVVSPLANICDSTGAEPLLDKFDPESSRVAVPVLPTDVEEDEEAARSTAFDEELAARSAVFVSVPVEEWRAKRPVGSCLAPSAETFLPTTNSLVAALRIGVAAAAFFVTFTCGCDILH